ncbi:MAG: glycine cleavage system aminomethyltransferase GcvT [bacterium]
MNEADSLRTCLFDCHQAAGGRIVPFAGWDMPVQYQSIQKEHLATRTGAGIFDVGHMGRLLIRGAQAVEFVNRLVTRDISKLQEWQVGYTLVCNAEGGVRDDILVYRGAGADIALVVNASNRLKILDWFNEHRSLWGSEVEILDNTLHTGMMAIQGPESEALTGRILGQDVSCMGYYRWREIAVDGVSIPVSRSGYTGEDGFEISGPPNVIEKIWKEAMAAGAEPCGLGSRDTLRLEMGYPLYGHELDENLSPWDAGLDRVIHLSKSDFVGRDALAAQKERGRSSRLTGFVLKDRGVPREKYPLFAKESKIGAVTSGGFSPSLSVGIGMAYVDVESVPDAVGIRERLVPVEETAPPFVPSRVKRGKKTT